MRPLALRFFLLLLAMLSLLALDKPASGYMSIRVSTGSPAEGTPVRWDLVASQGDVANGRILYEIDDAGCADRALFTGGINEFQAIQDSFSRWRGIRESNLDFEFKGSTTNAVKDANDHRNVIRFVGTGLSMGVFAVTTTTFDTTTGEITDADMEINDRDFTWDTLGPTGAVGTPGRAVIENVITHEIGHFVGLDHTMNAQSSMFYASSAGYISSASLERDDIAQIIEDYPHPTLDDPSLGSVSGNVKDSMMAGAFGVAVVLVDVATGKNVIGHVSEKMPVAAAGDYTVKGVPPGNYLAFALPIDKAQVGSYYSSALTTFYPVVRGVAVSTLAAPALVKVAPGAIVSGVDINLPASGANPFEPNGTSATATTITSGQVAVAQIAPAAEVDFYKFTVAAGQSVTIRALSDAFGLALNPTLTLFDTNGTTVLASPLSSSPVYVAGANDRHDNAFDIQGVDYDAEINYTFTAAGTYFFAIASRAGVTAGQYVVTFEIRGADTVADPVATKIISNVPGVPADGSTAFTINVEPRNAFGRALNAPTTFTVDLVDRTGAPVVLQTITTMSTPFNFTVTALSAPATKTYGCRVNGTDMAATIDVSHYATLSAANSFITLHETSLTANGYDKSLVIVTLIDGSGNLFADSAATVTVATTLGTLDNGTTQGASVPAVLDPLTATWRVTLVAGNTTGTASISATANSQAISAETIPFLTKATGTGTPPGGGGGGGSEEDGGGGCAAGTGRELWVVLALVALMLALKGRRSESAV